MKSQSEQQRERRLQPDDLSKVEATMAAWINEQKENGEFELAWAGAGNLIGGGLINVDSTEELEVIIFG